MLHLHVAFISSLCFARCLCCSRIADFFFLSILAKCNDGEEGHQKENGEQRETGLEVPGPKIVGGDSMGAPRVVT